MSWRIWVRGSFCILGPPFSPRQPRPDRLGHRLRHHLRGLTTEHGAWPRSSAAICCIATNIDATVVAADATTVQILLVLHFITINDLALVSS